MEIGLPDTIGITPKGHSGRPTAENPVFMFVASRAPHGAYEGK